MSNKNAGGAPPASSSGAASGSTSGSAPSRRHNRQDSRSFDELDLIRSSSQSSSVTSPVSADSASSVSSASHLNPAIGSRNLHRRRSLGAMPDHLPETSMELKEEANDQVGVLLSPTVDQPKRSSKLKIGKQLELVSDSMEKGAKRLANTLSGEDSKSKGKEKNKHDEENSNQ